MMSPAFFSSETRLRGERPYNSGRSYISRDKTPMAPRSTRKARTFARWLPARAGAPRRSARGTERNCPSVGRDEFSCSSDSTMVSSCCMAIALRGRNHVPHVPAPSFYLPSISLSTQRLNPIRRNHFKNIGRTGLTKKASTSSVFSLAGARCGTAYGVEFNPLSNQRKNLLEHDVGLLFG